MSGRPAVICIKRFILMCCRLQAGLTGGDRLSFTHGFGIKEILQSMFS